MKNYRRTYFCKLILGVIGIAALTGCGGVSAGGVNNPTVQAEICVCPGTYGRPTAACPMGNRFGDITIPFNCPRSSAVFLGLDGNPVCRAEIKSVVPSDPSMSASGILAVYPVSIDVPVTPPGQFQSFVFQTNANIPVGSSIGVAKLVAIDDATHVQFDLETVAVSNDCTPH
ncbi:MAG TPA: hypothetical protein VMH81_11145 [Bryobacteraceae bacterium]|nr:hypothetical protein [Bryobacteraceae bacterium]